MSDEKKTGQPRKDWGWDQVGRNPTGRPTRSSAGTRRKKARKLDKDSGDAS